jgi:uncharacterized protein involved in outer membrane biogenesis
MIRKIVIAIVAIVVLIAGGLLAATLLIDPNKFKGQIEQAVEDATGRKLTMAGKIGLNLFSLTPSLKVADVSLTNASWGSRPEMLKFKSLAAEVQLIPLLSSQININRITLDGADILLETNKDGTGNWVFAPAKAAPAPAGQPKDAKASAPPAIAVKHVNVKDLKFAYRDGKTGQTTNLGLQSLSLKADSNSAPLLIALAGTLNNKPLSINGKLATIETLKAGGDKPLPLNLDIKFGNSHIVGDLTVATKGTPRVAGKLNIPVLDVKELQEASGQTKAAAAPAQGQAAAPAGGKKRAFSEEPLNLSALKTAEADIDLTGDKIVLAGGDLTKLAAKIGLKGGRLALKPFTVDVKGSTLAGDVTVDGSGMPAIAIAATGRKIDVGALMQQPGQEKLIEGMADLDINLAGSGASMAAIAGGLNGRTQVAMGESRLNNKYLRIVAGDLFKIIDPWAAKEDTGKINCVLSKFDIKSGVATSQAMIVDGAAFAVLGDGKINLGPETLDLLVDAKPKNNSLLSVAVPIRVGGTLMEPSFAPDPGAALKGLMGSAGGMLAKGAGVATGGGLLGGAAGGVLGGVMGGGQTAQPAQGQPQAAADSGSGACGANLKAGAAQPAAQPSQPAAAPAQKPAAAPAPAAPSNPMDALGKGVKGILKP